MRINRQDTNGVKPLLAVGELGYDNYPSGGDIGRVYVGTGSSNIAQAKKAEVVAVDGKVDTHTVRVDNPHSVTKTQVGLSNVDNTSDVSKPISTAMQNALDLKQNLLVSGTNIKTIEGQSIVGAGNIDLTKTDVGLNNVDNTSDTTKVVASAGKWTTSRNITIGDTTKSVNGSVDISWSLNEIGAIGTASPAFTGVPTAPTAAVNTSTTQLATTAFVNAEIANDAIPRVTGINTAIPKFDGVSGAIQSSNILINSSDNVILPKTSGGSLTISLVDGASNTNLVLPESGTVATTSNLVGFKNYIINGNFDIWQRGVSQTSNEYGSDDRWFNGNNGSTKTHSQIACTATERLLFNASKFSRTTVSSVVGAGNYAFKMTAIEDVTKLAGKTITVSFWAKANSNKNIWLEFRQMFGTGGSPSVLVNGIYGQAVGLTTTWQKKTITLILPSIVGKTLGTDGVHTSSVIMQFWFDVGSGNTGRIPTGIQQSGTFDIAQVQLEEGSVATPFENRPIGLEVSLCQRYYETGYLHGVSYGNSEASYQRTQAFYKCDKRIAPSVTLSKISGDATGMGVIFGTTSHLACGFLSTDSSQEWYGTYTANAEL